MSVKSAGILLFRIIAGSSREIGAKVTEPDMTGPEATEPDVTEPDVTEPEAIEPVLAGQDASGLEVLLVHPGGPFWAGKDDGSWSIPKGIYQAEEDPLQAGKRELFEETGFSPAGPDSSFHDLGSIRQPSKKTVRIWALRCSNDCRNYDWERAEVRSNPFTMEWPKGSGITREFPEIDRAEWFDLAAAKKKILKGQAGFLDRLERMVESIEGPS